MNMSAGDSCRIMAAGVQIYSTAIGADGPDAGGSTSGPQHCSSPDGAESHWENDATVPRPQCRQNEPGILGSVSSVILERGRESVLLCFGCCLVSESGETDGDEALTPWGQSCFGKVSQRTGLPLEPPEYVEFIWNPLMFDKFQCDTLHALYLLQVDTRYIECEWDGVCCPYTLTHSLSLCPLSAEQVSLKKLRLRTIERHKYFTSIARLDRVQTMKDSPQINRNFRDWHAEDPIHHQFLYTLHWVHQQFNDRAFSISIIDFSKS